MTYLPDIIPDISRQGAGTPLRGCETDAVCRRHGSAGRLCLQRRSTRGNAASKGAGAFACIMK